MEKYKFSGTEIVQFEDYVFTPDENIEYNLEFMIPHEGCVDVVLRHDNDVIHLNEALFAKFFTRVLNTDEDKILKIIETLQSLDLSDYECCREIAKIVGIDTKETS